MLDIDRDMVFIAKPDNMIQCDFCVARYPVSATLYHAISGSVPDNHDASAIMRMTWHDAIRFCNALSASQHVPIPYCLETGALLDEQGEPCKNLLAVKGFRLPTLYEWEYAARGWSGRKTGDYFTIQQQHFKIPGLDYPTTDKQKMLYEHGYSQMDDLVVNHMGIYGMLVYAIEWYADFDYYNTVTNETCRWQENFVNYNNDIGYSVWHRPAEKVEEFPFRFVVSVER